MCSRHGDQRRRSAASVLQRAVVAAQRQRLLSLAAIVSVLASALFRVGPQRAGLHEQAMQRPRRIAGRRSMAAGCPDGVRPCGDDHSSGGENGHRTAVASRRDSSRAVFSARGR
jgi:hypothetical protein